MNKILLNTLLFILWVPALPMVWAMNTRKPDWVCMVLAIPWAIPFMTLGIWAIHKLDDLDERRK